METQMMKLTEISPAEYNPRIELKPGSKDYEALKKSLDRFGQVEPLVVNVTTGTLISGHQRLNVLKEQGVEEAEVVAVELSEEQEKLLNVALNKIDGEWDFEKLHELFNEISTGDIEFTGFTEGEIENLFGDFESTQAEEESDEAEEETETGFARGSNIPDADAPFTIFLSFPNLETAQEWLQEEGIEGKFRTGRSMTIKMEGVEYGKVN